MTSLARVVFGVLGNITAAFLFLSPVPTFWRIIKTRRVEDFSGVPYLTSALNCSLWTLYGLPVVNYQVLVVTINAAGAALEIFYVVIYLIFSDGKPRMKVLKLFIAMASGFILMTGLVLGLVKDLDTRRTILGVLGAALALAMYSAPLTIMRLVIQTKSVEFMPFLLSLFVLLNSSTWTIYAFVPKIDLYIGMPNAIGVLLGTGQLVLYAIYRRSTPRKPFLAPADKTCNGEFGKGCPCSACCRSQSKSRSCPCEDGSSQCLERLALGYLLCIIITALLKNLILGTTLCIL